MEDFEIDYLFSSENDNNSTRSDSENEIRVGRKEIPFTKILKRFIKLSKPLKKKNWPKKEYLILFLIRNTQNLFRCVIKNKLPSKKAIKIQFTDENKIYFDQALRLYNNEKDHFKKISKANYGRNLYKS